MQIEGITEVFSEHSVNFINVTDKFIPKEKEQFQEQRSK